MSISNKKISIADDCLVQQMGDGIVIMNLKTEHFYELDAIGKRFWELFAEHGDINKVSEILMQEYDVTPDVLKRDVAELIENLRKAELINLNDA